MTRGMHDHPGIWPVLPGRDVTEEAVHLMLEPVRGTEWETCWEYVVSHELTEGEGAAFWNGAHLGITSRPASAWVVYAHDHGPYAIALYATSDDASKHAARAGYGIVAEWPMGTEFADAIKAWEDR